MPSSLWPLPSTPASPTISPGRISRVKLSSRTAPWRSCTVRPSQTRAKPFGPSDSSTAGASSASASATSSGRNSRPTMAWTSAPMSASFMLSSATSRPVRSTATRSATLAISASLCVTRMTARPESATRRQMSSKRADLAGRQHGGRLVEHQKLGIAHQALHDLGALALADRELADHRLGIEGEAEALGDVADARAELVALQHAPDLAQHQVLDHGHARHQAEMLVHHGDALLQRLGRASRRPGRAVEGHVARRRLVDAEDQVAQGRLAGAVLAQQALHGAGAHVEADAFERLQAAEALTEISRATAAIRRTTIRRPTP